GTFPFRGDSNTASFRLDHRFSDRNTLFLRTNFSKLANDNTDFGGLQGVSNGASTHGHNSSAAASHTHVFSQTALNNFKFQFSQFRTEVLTNDAVGPEIVISGVANIGREIYDPTGYRWNTFQLVDDFTLLRGRHSMKMGFDADVK